MNDTNICPHCGNPLPSIPVNVAGANAVQPYPGLAGGHIPVANAACNPITILPGQSIHINLANNGCAGGMLPVTYVKF
jgi:hypothetical protein